MKNSILKIFTILSIAILLFGCLSSASVENTTSVTNSDVSSGMPVPTENGTPVDEMIVKEESDVIKTADNKTSQEKIQESVELAVANGTYADKLTYAYHSGSEVVDVTLTVENDVVVNASVVPSSDAHNVSVKIINNFNAALPELVVGKKITELNIPKNVAGSSLTTAAFKAYVDKVIAEN